MLLQQKSQPEAASVPVKVTVKNTLLLLLILFHVGMLVYWNLPEDSYVYKSLFGNVRWYMQYSGLWQNWEMFAPHPPQHALNIKIIGITAAGNETHYEPLYQSANIVLFTRDRKFHENALGNWPSALRYYMDYWCRRINRHVTNEEESVIEVKLLAQFQPITPLGEHEKQPDAPYEERASRLC